MVCFVSPSCPTRILHLCPTLAYFTHLNMDHHGIDYRQQAYWLCSHHLQDNCCQAERKTSSNTFDDTMSCELFTLRVPSIRLISEVTLRQSAWGRRSGCPALVWHWGWRTQESQLPPGGKGFRGYSGDFRHTAACCSSPHRLEEQEVVVCDVASPLPTT